MTHELISIIVITRNEQEHIGRLLESLLALEAPHPIEIVIVDGDSTDQTRAIVQQYRGRERPVRCVPLSRYGFGLQRNVGADLARGEYLLYLSADVEPSAQLLKRYCAAIERGYDIVQGTALDVCRTPGSSRQALCRFRSFVYRPRMLQPNGECSTINLLIRRSVVIAERFDETLAALEDRELFWRIRDRVRYHRASAAAVFHIFDETVAQFWKKVFREALCSGRIGAPGNDFRWLTITGVCWASLAAGGAVALRWSPHHTLVPVLIGALIGWTLSSLYLLRDFVFARRWRTRAGALHWLWMAPLYTSAVAGGMSVGYLRGAASRLYIRSGRTARGSPGPA